MKNYDKKNKENDTKIEKKQNSDQNMNDEDGKLLF